MTGRPSHVPDEVRETVQELRKRLGLFSFRHDAPAAEVVRRDGPGPELSVRPGGIVEWLSARPGAGAVTSALQVVSQSYRNRGVWAVVDPARECYVPAIPGWGVPAHRTLLIRPTTVHEMCWAIEQCLRCPGISATWAWVDRKVPARALRRWQSAGEVGGGIGLFFRPDTPRRGPVWADLRLLVTPQAGGAGETRRVRVNVLYRRGGLGGSAQVWEINHAAGLVHLVPEVAHPTAAERAAGA